MDNAAIETSAQSWRDVLPVHPAADLFPPLSHDELLALGQDIKKHGVKQWIVTWSEDFNGRDIYLLDGRNRLDAMEAVGIAFEIDRRGGVRGQPKGLREYRMHAGDPFAIVMSLNMHRRHLTAEDKRNVIANLLREDPSKSNRSVGTLVKADHKTVGAVRDAMQATGEIPQLDKTTGADGKARSKPAKKAKTVIDAAQVDRDRAECIALNNKVLEAETVARFTAHVAAYDAAQAEIEEIRAELAKPVSGQKIITAEQRKAEYAAEEDEEKEHPENHRTVFFLRAEQAQKLAVSSCEVDEEMASTARAVAATWSRLADNAETADDGEVTDKDMNKTFLLMVAGVVESAQRLDKHFNVKPNADVLDAARYAADEWTKLAEKLAEEVTLSRKSRAA